MDPTLLALAILAAALADAQAIASIIQTALTTGQPVDLARIQTVTDRRKEAKAEFDAELERQRAAATSSPSPSSGS